ncbi:hypothetical protein C0J45_22078 [Silurus meridionalis]|nr:hypothetical protein C0J45_22078 [Silurus meridionalis]
MKIVIIAVCLIGLVCATQVDEELEREKRSSSGEGYGGRFMPSYYPYYFNNNNNNNLLQTLLPLLLLLPTPAPAPAPPAGGK